MPPVSPRRWKVGERSGDAALARELGQPPLIAALLYRRGVTSTAAAESFFEPTLGDLHPPMTLRGMPEAFARLRRAGAAHERVVVFGDYDVDGLTAAAQLKAGLGRIGAETQAFIPHRLEDGYGLRVGSAEKVLALRPAVVITVDCGISSLEGVGRLVDAGVDVIVTDHHLPKEELPARAIIVNPKQPGCPYPFKELAGTGVAFKLLQALAESGDPIGPLTAYLRVACLGTIADVVPLIGENRAIAKLGTRELATARSPGLRALLERTGLTGKVPSAEDVGFRIGPRLNAAGRVDFASRALELLETRDGARAAALVAELETMNSERRSLQDLVEKDARRMLTDDPAQLERRAIVLAAAGWHRGVVGIAAARISREFSRPTLLLAIDGESAGGSGRSLPGIHLHAALTACSELLGEFGGHAAAVGLALPVANLPALREALDGALAASTRVEDFAREEEADFVADLGELADPALLPALARFEPTGAGNPRPAFVVTGARVRSWRPIGGAGSLAGQLEARGAAMPFVCWRPDAESDAAVRSGGAIDLLVRVEADDYRGGAPRLSIVSAREARE